MLVPPTVAAPSQVPTKTLPLLEGVPPELVLPIGFALLAILVIALAAAHAEHVRADAFAHALISKLPEAQVSDARALLDILRVPGLTRVAPIALWARGGWQQDGRAWLRPFRRVAGGVLYLLLKLVVIAVLFVVPALALWESYDQVKAAHLGITLTRALGVLMWIALLSLSLIGSADLVNTWTRVRKFFEREDKPKVGMP